MPPRSITIRPPPHLVSRIPPVRAAKIEQSLAGCRDPKHQDASCASAVLPAQRHHPSRRHIRPATSSATSRLVVLPHPRSDPVSWSSPGAPDPRKISSARTGRLPARHPRITRPHARVEAAYRRGLPRRVAPLHGSHRSAASFCRIRVCRGRPVVNRRD